MAFLGNEIIQTRRYIDSSQTNTPPNKNYKLTFPITTYAAVRKTTEPDSNTLDEEIESIISSLESKQSMIPAKSGNHIMTYGGVPGIIGSVKMVNKVSWDPKNWSDSRIPTEKAVGELMMKYGLGEKDNNIAGDTIPWANILGKPIIHNGLGDDIDGLINQAALTKVFNKSINDLLLMDANITEELDVLSTDYISHKEDTDNPHNLTPSSIGAASKEDFKSHNESKENPHNVKKEQIGLGNVDNTSDIDKPVSKLTQNEIDKINQKLAAIDESTGLMNFISTIEYNQLTGRLYAIYSDGSRRGVNIITNTLVDEIEFDKSKSSIIVTELSGFKKEISLKDIENKYTGIDGDKINIIINTDNSISAILNPKSITSDDIADKSITSQLIADNSISDSSLKNESITNEKIKNQTITGDKIEKQTITNTHIKNMSISIDKLAGSDLKNMILVSKTPNANPTWSKLTKGLLSEELIEAKHIANKSITNKQILDYTIITSNIADKAITNKKIEDKTITNDKIVNGTITSELIDQNITFTGNPKVSNDNIADDSIVSAKWVNDKLLNYIISDSNIAPRTIIGKYLFSSRVKNRVLLVPEVDADPVWGQVTEDMIADQGIDGNKIKDNSINSLKIKNENILSKHIIGRAITNSHLMDNCVTSDKIFQSDQDDMVLAATNTNKHPVYTKVTNKMIENDAITNNKISDSTITPEKFAKIGTMNTILCVKVEGQTPIWSKVNTSMLENNVITSSKIFKSENPNMVLAARDADSTPFYMKVTGDMVESKTLDNKHIIDNSINGNKILNKTITNDKIAENTITGSRIKYDAITGNHIMKTDIPYQVLAVDDRPQDGAKWLTLMGDMFGKNSIDINRLKKPNTSYTILAIKSLNKDLEFIKITNEFIEDNTIDSSKLKNDLILKGNPTLDTSPHIDADNKQLVDTNWVNLKLAKLSTDVNSPESLISTIDRLTQTQVDIIKSRLRIDDISSLTQDEVKRRVNEAIGELNNLIKNSNVQGTVEEIISRKITEKLSGDLNVIMTNSNIADNSISTSKLQNNSITSEKLDDGSIIDSKIANNSIMENHISDNPIIKEINIYDNAVTKNKIKNDSITNDKILKNSLSGDRLDVGTILPSNIKVDKSEYEQLAVRNIIISNSPPRSINDNVPNGSLWMQYI